MTYRESFEVGLQTDLPSPKEPTRETSSQTQRISTNSQNIQTGSGRVNAPWTKIAVLKKKICTLNGKIRRLQGKQRSKRFRVRKRPQGDSTDDFNVHVSFNNTLCSPVHNTVEPP